MVVTLEVMHCAQEHNMYYVGLNDNGIGHLIFKLSTKQILTTMKYQPVLCLRIYSKQSIKKIRLITTRIQIDNFGSDAPF